MHQHDSGQEPVREAAHRRGGAALHIPPGGFNSPFARELAGLEPAGPEPAGVELAGIKQAGPAYNPPPRLAAASAAGVAESSYLPWLETVAPRNSPVFEGSVEDFLRPDPFLAEERVEMDFASLVHDARNMVTAMEMYCDLLEEPGVLSEPFRHYAKELRMVSAASRRMLERLARARLSAPDRDPSQGGLPDGTGRAAKAGSNPGQNHDAPPGPRLVASAVTPLGSPEQHGRTSAGTQASGFSQPRPSRHGRMQAFSAGEPVESLADELHANRNLLAAVAGQSVTVGITVHAGDPDTELHTEMQSLEPNGPEPRNPDPRNLDPGNPDPRNPDRSRADHQASKQRSFAMTREDLTRVLVNLARNAGEAMPGGGHLQITLEESPEATTLTFADTGTGIARAELESIFSPGYTTHVSLSEGRESPELWPVQHRGLGLAIVRSIVSASGGTVWAANRTDAQGALFTLEFPAGAGV